MGYKDAECVQNYEILYVKEHELTRQLTDEIESLKKQLDFFHNQKEKEIQEREKADKRVSEYKDLLTNARSEYSGFRDACEMFLKRIKIK